MKREPQLTLFVFFKVSIRPLSKQMLLVHSHFGTWLQAAVTGVQKIVIGSIESVLVNTELFLYFCRWY